MKFNKHPLLEGLHAFLSPSKYNWIRYDEPKLRAVYSAQMISRQGTELHELAARLIKLRVKLPKINKTLNMYVNDGIGYRMEPEVCLFYSTDCFGTADTISFHNNVLRIHDLKTGKTEPKIDQLRIYAAMFCLEYGYDPRDLDLIELRIYYLDDVIIEKSDPNDIIFIMDKIKFSDKIIKEMRE